VKWILCYEQQQFKKNEGNRMIVIYLNSSTFSDAQVVWTIFPFLQS